MKILISRLRSRVKNIGKSLVVNQPYVMTCLFVFHHNIASPSSKGSCLVCFLIFHHNIASPSSKEAMYCNLRIHSKISLKNSLLAKKIFVVFQTNPDLLTTHARRACQQRAILSSRSNISSNLTSDTTTYYSTVLYMPFTTQHIPF
jgi:hypothetical protein